MTVLLILLRNLRRHKLRASLSFIAVFLAATFLHLYIGASYALDSLFQGATLQRTMFVKPRFGALFETTLPNHYSSDIAKMPGVVAATAVAQWGAHWGNTDDRYVFVVAIDPPQFRTIVGKDFDHLPPGVYERFASDPSAILVSRGARINYGIDVGRRLEIELFTHKELPLSIGYKPPANTVFVANVVGEVTKGIFSDRVILTHLGTASRVLDLDRGIGVLLRYDPSVSSEELARRIEANFASSGGEEVEALALDNWIAGLRTFVGQLQNLVLVTLGLAGMLAAMLLLHGAAMAGFELLPTIATLRALGSSSMEMLLLLAGEGLLVSLGAAATSTLTLLLVTSNTTLVDLKKIDPTLAPVFTVTTQGGVLVLFFALLIGCAGAIPPAAQLRRSTIAALRRSQ